MVRNQWKFFCFQWCCGEAVAPASSGGATAGYFLRRSPAGAVLIGGGLVTVGDGWCWLSHVIPKPERASSGPQVPDAMDCCGVKLLPSRFLHVGPIGPIPFLNGHQESLRVSVDPAGQPSTGSKLIEFVRCFLQTLLTRILSTENDSIMAIE